MYVRVARWEGVSPEAIRESSEQIESRDGPPEGIPAKRLVMLADEARGNVMMIPFFETEDDRATADETLKTMTPPGGMGPPTVEMYEVKLDLMAPE